MLSTLLIGKSVASFQIREHGFCVLELSGGFSLSFECLGRFVGPEGLFLTTEDNGQRFGLPAPFDAAASIGEKIKGRTIERAVIREETNDLTLYFATGFLEILCTSAGFEAYQVRGPNHLIVVARGGKEEAEPGATDNPDDAQRLREDH